MAMLKELAELPTTSKLPSTPTCSSDLYIDKNLAAKQCISPSHRGIIATSSPHGTLLAVDSGPGVGVHVANVFAERGFRKVILASRNGERLAEEVEDVRSAGGEGVQVAATQIDLASNDSVEGALGEMEKHLSSGPALEAVVFNAARIGPSKMFELTERELERGLQVRPPYPPCVGMRCAWYADANGVYPDLRNVPLHHSQPDTSRTRRDRQRPERWALPIRDGQHT